MYPIHYIPYMLVFHQKNIKHAVKSNDIRVKWFNPQCSTSVSLSNCLNAYHTYPGISQETYILGLRPTIFFP